MTLSVVSLAFDCVLALLLAVMIYYAVTLNRRISALRERESEMLEMVAQFNQSSEAAHASARKLRAAGAEAEMLVKAAIAKGLKARDDLETTIDRAEFAAESLIGRASANARPEPPAALETAPKPPRGAPRPQLQPRSASATGAEVRVKPFVPPSRDGAEVVNAGDRDDAGPVPRSDAEMELLAAIRAAKQGIA